MDDTGDGNHTQNVSSIGARANGCRGDELEFFFDRRHGSTSSWSSWSLLQISQSSRRHKNVTLLVGDSESNDYPYLLCLPRSACHKLCASGVDPKSNLLCEAAPEYELRIDDDYECVSRSYGDVIQFGECDKLLRLSSDPDPSDKEWEGYQGPWRNTRSGKKSISDEGSVCTFTFLYVGLSLALVLIGCAIHRQRRNWAATANADVSPAGNDQRDGAAGRAATPRRPHRRVTPSLGPAYGTKKRRQFVIESLVTKELTAADVAPDADDDNEGKASRNSVKAFVSGKERSDFVQSSMHSLEVHMAKPAAESITYSDGMCAICLGEYVEDGKICTSRNPGCAHVFHADCMAEWLLNHEECPNCRLKYLSGSSENV